MKNFKRILLALSIAISMGAFSSVSLAEKAKIPPGEVINSMAEKINEATALIAKGGESRDEVANLFKIAKDISKEVSANDKVDRIRQREQSALKVAIAAAKKGDMEGAKAAAVEALKLLDDMRSAI